MQPKFDNHMIITFGPAYRGDNPKLPGSLAFQAFSLYREGMTVAEYIRKNGPKPRANLIYDEAKGFIRITKPRFK
jgi:hypothetical protein